MTNKTAARDQLLAIIDATAAADIYDTTPENAVADAISEALRNQPVLRHCLVPGCLREYDAVSCMEGDPPPRPEWSGEGWHTLGCGSIFPAGGHICPEHLELVKAHWPRRIELPHGRWSVDCACGWTPVPQRWHGVLRALWEQHLLTVTGDLPEAPPVTDPEHRVPLEEHTADTLTELYDRLWDAETGYTEARDIGRATFVFCDHQRTQIYEQSALLAAVYRALWSLRHNLVASSRDWSLEPTDAWVHALLVGWGCEEQHEHGDDCEIGALDEIAHVHGWSAQRTGLARKHRATLAKAGPNGESEAAAARAAMADKTSEED
ncbi:hypothetical protein [Streptomyces sp. NPDC005407]|uniref:hypothetical protein n=1 Tax=Streptomyces sp. NPDC005407 TaxID=3155340 RepID=UPI0033B45313